MHLDNKGATGMVAPTLITVPAAALEKEENMIGAQIYQARESRLKKTMDFAPGTLSVLA
jgi:hypothetical protein